MTKLQYQRVGNSTYKVKHDGDAEVLVWRTRDGWSASVNGKQVVDDYRGSRDVAASVALRHAETPDV